MTMHDGDAPLIDGYHSLVRIGRGGLGDVYRATQASTGATVAIKVLRDVSDSSVAWHRTRRELAALVALGGHANVIQSVELLELPSGPALVMEHAPGGSVADLMASRSDSGGLLSVDETIFVGRQTASALMAAHAKGIVHRDIKPQNLLIDSFGQIKLCDFGIAALTLDDQYRTRTNAVSMRYASPEDLEHDLEVGPRSDVYSLGATLLHLVRGAPPTLRERLAPWVPPLTDDSHLAALDRVMARCLHPTPSVRPTAKGLLDALDGLALGSGIDRVSALTGAPSPSPELAVMRFDDEPELDRDATTVSRPNRLGDPIPERRTDAAPIRPAPAPSRSRMITWWAAGVLSVVAVAALAALAFRPESGRTPAAPAITTAVPVTVVRPALAAPLTDADWSAGAVGDCLVQGDAAVLDVIDCAQPHDLQRFAAGTLPGAVAGLPGFDPVVVAEAATIACDEAFRRFVGVATVSSALDVARTRPTEQTWADGDRRYQCYLGVRDVLLVGDARSTGW